MAQERKSLLLKRVGVEVCEISQKKKFVEVAECHFAIIYWISYSRIKSSSSISDVDMELELALQKVVPAPAPAPSKF